MFESTAHSGATKSQSRIIAYWMSLCTDECLPKREDIDPGAVRGVLGNLSILACGQDGDVRFRLVGSKVRSIFGQSVSAGPVPSHNQGRGAPWSMGLKGLADTNRPVWGVTDFGTDRHAWVRMPLSSDGSGDDLVLCYDALLAKNAVFAKPDQSSFLSYSVSDLAA